jgi:hypothetical protein
MDFALVIVTDMCPSSLYVYVHCHCTVPWTAVTTCHTVVSGLVTVLWIVRHAPSWRDRMPCAC